ncbi:hypothetical protein H257_02684 [Aphanomyces astaci]|uniref:WRKY19-like zinc finger domain-containing protein n=1 Tax=Aphanomyces astaci TaxID=112090 RepID=W4H540_APHAT|nr:hypothetical protein H257_02684 [Aphanomyces astaci]ETV86258.1 hypothetical protein H257_02684 [Aphanomyces astaci]|eukprot:XP_009824730.1 hypothetical protein H257_02684 [Aphanomyces astaci]
MSAPQEALGQDDAVRPPPIVSTTRHRSQHPPQTSLPPRARSTSESGTSMSIVDLLNPSSTHAPNSCSDEDEPSCDENKFKQEDLLARPSYNDNHNDNHTFPSYEDNVDEFVNSDDTDDSAFQKRGLSCSIKTCPNKAVSKGRCISHGGGCRCKVTGCKNGAKMYGLCHLHGGRKKCKHPGGCGKFAKSLGLCWAHGGSKTCGQEGCEKGALKGGFCWAHGGGKRCRAPSCQKPVKSGDVCSLHYKDPNT